MKLIPNSTQAVSITLYQGVPFSNNYVEHTLLSNMFKYRNRFGGVPTNVGSNKNAFLDMKLDGINYYFPRTELIQSTYNFAYGNGLVTSVVLELSDNAINSNYMKVVAGQNVYYYFITGITQKNEKIYQLNLELDVFMTFGDEMLTNLQNKPIMIERKHCRRLLLKGTPILPYKVVNPVCFNQESTFSQLKSNLVKEFTPLEFKQFLLERKDNPSIIDDFNPNMGKLTWIYFIIGHDASLPVNEGGDYTENYIRYPYKLICLPLLGSRTNALTFRGTWGDTEHGFDFNALFGEDVAYFSTLPSTLKVILSPFPPFNVCTGLKGTLDTTNPNVNEIWCNYRTYNENTNYRWATIYTGIRGSGYIDDEAGSELLLVKGKVVGTHDYIQVEYGSTGTFSYKEIENYFEIVTPTINDSRNVGEYKLVIAPFKDLRIGSYYGSEYRVNTQLLFLNQQRGENYAIKPFTITSNNPECNSFFNYIQLNDKCLSSKMGVSSSVSYNLPTGTDAKLLFNQTQANQYENSKVVGAITNGLKIIGGALGVAFGGAMGKIGGAVSIGSGITGEINTFTDWGAKMEDLNNTPNTYNFSGSSFSYDTSYSKANGNGHLLPYLITYSVSEVEYNMASEFLYNYGYEYNCESYFNTEIRSMRDEVFERQLFNYVKIKEDITTKLVGDNLPLVVAQKINAVLNAGIKFWNFFNFDFTNSSQTTSIINNYFQKTNYCNAELYMEN